MRSKYKTRKFKREFKRATLESIPYILLIAVLLLILWGINCARMGTL